MLTSVDLSPPTATAPACAGRADIFTDELLESPPAANACAEQRRRHAGLVAQAEEVCQSCPLLAGCLYRAVVEYDVAGYVAGTSERQRGEIRRRLGVRVQPEDLDTWPVSSAGTGRSTTTKCSDFAAPTPTRVWTGWPTGSGAPCPPSSGISAGSGTRRRHRLSRSAGRRSGRC